MLLISDFQNFHDTSLSVGKKILKQKKFPHFTRCTKNIEKHFFFGKKFSIYSYWRKNYIFNLNHILLKSFRNYCDLLPSVRRFEKINKSNSHSSRYLGISISVFSWNSRGRKVGEKSCEMKSNESGRYFNLTSFLLKFELRTKTLQNLERKKMDILRKPTYLPSIFMKISIKLFFDRQKTWTWKFATTNRFHFINATI